MRPLRIVLDPGHGGHDPGAVGVNGLRESQNALLIAMQTKRKLDAAGVHAWLTRTNDAHLELHERLDLARRVSADLFLSIHHNSAARSVEGFETIYEKDVHGSEDFARMLQNLVVVTFPDHKNRGIKDTLSPDYQRAIYVVKHSLCPSALIELEFISNERQEIWMQRTEVQDKLAATIAMAVQQYGTLLNLE